jgi:ATP-binding cassette subfamily F protein 3
MSSSQLSGVDKDAISASLSDIPVHATSGPTEERLAEVDWTSRDSMISVFPPYFQEQYKMQKGGKKTMSKSVDLEYFQLKTPFGDRTLIDDSPLKIEAGKRQCLYGANSTGKTLLFSNMSAGTLKGWPKHIGVHHLKELEPHELHDTVLGTVVNSHPLRNALLACKKVLPSILEAEKDETKKEAIQLNLDYVDFNLNSIRSEDAEDRAKKMLRVLGFDDVGMSRPCSSLSGGLRMRVALCVAFFIEADLLLLDEPTNHLDFPSVLWLEGRLRGYRGSFILVSHDRVLLNQTTTATILIEDQKLTYYQMGFKDFEAKKEKDDKKKYDDNEKFLNKNQNFDPSTQLGRLVHDRKVWSQKYYEKQVALAGKFTFPPPTPLKVAPGPDGKVPAQEDVILIDMKNLRFSYDVATGHFIFNDPISFQVKANTRIGVMGPNGAGKSTLLKLLTHKLTPTEGTVTDHPGFVLAYFGQHSTAELDLEKTPMEFMTEHFPDENHALLKTYLSKTGVVGTLADTRMKRLSFSQRSCVVFSKLTFRCPHLLIMDEPTNFLDLESVDSLISACNKYRGALLLVSHNRDFLSKCAKQFLSVVPGQFLLFDDLKRAESSTYTFIQELEEGGSGAKLVGNSLSAGGGALSNFGQKGAEEKKVEEPAVKRDKDGALVFGAGPSKPAAKPVAKPAAAAAAGPVYVANEKIKALWQDGKFYNAIVKKVEAGGKYSVLYTDYGNTVILPASNMQKIAAAPAAAAKTAAPAAAAKK